MNVLYVSLVVIVLLSIFYIDRIEPFHEECQTSECDLSDKALKNIINENISEFNSMSIEGFTNDTEYVSPQKNIPY